VDSGIGHFTVLELKPENGGEGLSKSSISQNNYDIFVLVTSPSG